MHSNVGNTFILKTLIVFKGKFFYPWYVKGKESLSGVGV